MSAQIDNAATYRRMEHGDLDRVAAIEDTVHAHPWTRGNFADSLRSGYECWTWRGGTGLVGYFVLMVAAGEGHLLNLSVAAAQQRRGHGAALLREVMRMARERGAGSLFLEVRPTNAAALALYGRFGFRQIGLRRGYYPAHGGREDALVLSITL